MTIPYNPLLKPPLGTPLNRGHKLAEGLVASWLMNEGVKDEAFDSSGYNYDGTLVADTHWVPGKSGSALDFDGNSDYVLLGNIPVLDGATQYTIIARIKIDTLTKDLVIVRKYDTGQQAYILQFDTAADELRIGAHDGSKSYLAKTTNANLTANTWYDIVAVWSGLNAGQIYVNTRAVAMSDVVATGPTHINTSSSESLTFGAKYDQGVTPDGFFDGQIEYVMMWRRALSASEIALLYREPFCMFKDPAEIALLGGYVEEEPPPEGIVVLRRRRESA